MIPAKTNFINPPQASYLTDSQSDLLQPIPTALSIIAQAPSNQHLSLAAPDLLPAAPSPEYDSPLILPAAPSLEYDPPLPRVVQIRSPKYDDQDVVTRGSRVTEAVAKAKYLQYQGYPSGSKKAIYKRKKRVEATERLIRAVTEGKTELVAELVGLSGYMYKARPLKMLLKENVIKNKEIERLIRQLLPKINVRPQKVQGDLTKIF